jgi:heat shock protein HslJ
MVLNRRLLPGAALASAATLAACAAAPTPPWVPLAQHGEWLVVAIDGVVARPGPPTTLRLGGDGRLSGHTACNGYFGSYQWDGESWSTGRVATTHPERTPESLATPAMATTRMACTPSQMEAERRYLGVLERVNAWALREDGSLLLRAGDEHAIQARRR